MAKNKYVTEEEFEVIKALTKYFRNAEIMSICKSIRGMRSDTTLKEIRRAENFEAYQTRNAEPMATVVVNGAKFEGTISECLERLQKAKKN